MQFSFFLPNHSLPKYTTSWKLHLRLLIGMGRSPTYVLKFITFACEFLNRSSCHKLRCLAERNQIFISGPNNVFIGSHNLRLVTSTFVDIALFSLPPRFASFLFLPTAPAHQTERTRRHDPYESRTWQNPLFVNIPMKINCESSPRKEDKICTFYFCLLGPSMLLSFLTGEDMHRFTCHETFGKQFHNRYLFNSISHFPFLKNSTHLEMCHS